MIIWRRNPEGIYELDKSHLTDFFAQRHNRHPKIEKYPTRSYIYNEIFSGTNLYDFLNTNLFQDRCRIYFNHLSFHNPDWMVNPDEKLLFDRDGYRSFESYEEMEQAKIDQSISEAEENGETFIPPSDESIREKYEILRKKVLGGEQMLHDYMAHVRIYNKCFMGTSAGNNKNDHAFVKKQQKFLKTNVRYTRDDPSEASVNLLKDEVQCNSVESKLFPWLTNEYPIYTRWDGTTVNFPGSTGKFTRKKNCFLSEYKSRLNGKGIVLTLSDFFVNDATRFLRLLRHLGNTYPVQIVYHEDFSEKSRANLVRAARDPFKGYPPIDLWFVNAERTFDKKYKEHFRGFANKIIAAMFNSFEEMIVCDADSVLLQPPSYFFELQRYIDTGTNFYKDRSSGYYRDPDDPIFFQKLMPSVEDSAIFNIPQITNYTLENPFFEGFSDYMESGVLAINRKKHFIQPMIMSILTFYEPVINRVYGDKELFWLALVLDGDENYSFNKHFAAAIGEFTPDHERHKDVGSIRYFRSKELCSSHPAHISDEDNQTLVWFNSGFRHCGNSHGDWINWEKEFNKKKRYTRILTLEEFKTFFRSALRIFNAIIPPVTYDALPNDEGEPDDSWRLANYCYYYLWCAYSLVGGYYVDRGVTKDNLISGHIVTFTPEQIKSFEAAAEAWIAPFEWEEIK